VAAAAPAVVGSESLIPAVDSESLIPAVGSESLISVGVAKWERTDSW